MQNGNNGSNTALAVKQQQQALMVPRSLGEAIQFAKLIADTEMVPKQFRSKPGDIVAAIAMGADVGLSPMQALRNIAVINGRASLWGDGMLAVTMAHPEWGGIKEDDLPVIEKNGAATCIVQRKGQGSRKVTYTVEMAKKAKLWGKQGPWSEHPARMLQVRARGWALRDLFPDALGGLIPAEEAMDMPPVDVTPRDLPGDATLAKIVERIESAVNEQELNTVVFACSSLENADEKAKAKAVYLAKLKQIRDVPEDGKSTVGVSTSNGLKTEEGERCEQAGESPAASPETEKQDEPQQNGFDYGPPPISDKEAAELEGAGF